jgi:hypothetical protein
MAFGEVNAGSIRPLAFQHASAVAGRDRRWLWCLAIALMLGAAFRLIWGGAIEFKRDEAWVYRLVTEHVDTGAWAPLGMPSSQEVLVPGLSIWVFYPLSYVFGADDPTALARGVQICSLAALLALVVFTWRCVPAEEREPWLWAAALIAVNPIAVIYQRKLWPPCMLPVFCMMFLIGWWHRERRWGAFAWGVVGALLGQIHASGFLFAGAVFLATIWAQRRSVRWLPWLIGSALGCLPMAGWVLYMLTKPDAVHENFFAFNRWIEGKFWTHWATEPLGFGLGGILGTETGEFLRWPLIGGHPTYGGAILQGLAIVLGAIILGKFVVRRWREPRNLRARPSSSTLLVHAVFFGYGLLLTLAAVRFYRHYLLVAYPLMALWLARLALPSNIQGAGLAWGRRWLLALGLVNALCTALLLTYLHTQGGAPGGAFGPSYEQQVRLTGERLPHVVLPIDEQ